MDEELPTETPGEVRRTLEEPNGERVTMARLYRALYDMDGRIIEQFGMLHARLNCTDSRITQSEGRVDDHISNHPGSAKASIIRISGISGIIAAVVTAAGAILGAIIHRGW